jgi:phosphoesterase RecJ-like protein
MGLLPKEQILDQINKSETILICVGKNPNGDALGSALGFYLFLKKLGKKADIVSPTAILSKYSFLPSSETITHKLEGVRDYILSLDIDKEKLHQLRYEVQNNKLKIFITAKNGDLEEKDIILESARFKYDLIMVLGTADSENLGSIYDENSDLFYEAPVINIDHNPSNEYFGKINLVDVTASSTSEIIFNLIVDIKEELIDEQMATNLLEGIIFETNSFQNKNTTPKAFLSAASLITKGANKQEIVRYLYKTKSISTLKLMGKIMSSLKYNGEYKLGWSVISEDNNDFIKTNASPEKLSLVVKELADSSPEFDLVLLICKIGGKINGIINFSEKLQVDGLAKLLNGKIEENQIVFTFNETETKFAEESVLQKIKEWIDEVEK